MHDRQPDTHRCKRPALFTKGGGSLGSSGSLMFMFERKGLIRIAASAVPDIEEFELELIDHGLDDLVPHEQELLSILHFKITARC
jgi:transcriptional/translational regulatory protein YebC/TACO1